MDAALQELVRQRARLRCEYCLLTTFISQQLPFNRLAALGFLLSSLMLVGCGNRTIDGTLSPEIKNGRTNHWKSVQVLVTDETNLKQLVKEYNREVTGKFDDFNSRYREAYKTLGEHGGRVMPNGQKHPAAIWSEWRHLKLTLNGKVDVATNATGTNLSGISGLSGGSGQPAKGNAASATSIIGLSGGTKMPEKHKIAQPFLSARGNERGEFKVTLPHGGKWCFFVIAQSNESDLRQYYFKRATFGLFRSVKIDSSDRLSGMQHTSELAGRVISRTDPIGSDEEFIPKFLKHRYGLVDPEIEFAPSDDR